MLHHSGGGDQRTHRTPCAPLPQRRMSGEAAFHWSADPRHHSWSVTCQLPRARLCFWNTEQVRYLRTGIDPIPGKSAAIFVHLTAATVAIVARVWAAGGLLELRSHPPRSAPAVSHPYSLCSSANSFSGSPNSDHVGKIRRAHRPERRSSSRSD